MILRRMCILIDYSCLFDQCMYEVGTERRNNNVSVDVIRMVVDFCIYLRRHIECDILVTSDMHDEICLLKNQTIIWNEDVMHLSPWKSVFSFYLNNL